MKEQLQEVAKSTADATAVGVTLGTIFGYLPYVAALFTIVWTGIRIYETVTVRKWIKRIRRK